MKIFGGPESLKFALTINFNITLNIEINLTYLTIFDLLLQNCIDSLLTLFFFTNMTAMFCSAHYSNSQYHS